MVGHSCIAYSFLAKGDIHTFVAHATIYFIHNTFELVLEKILYYKYCSGFVATVLFRFREKYFTVNMYCSGLIHMGVKHLRKFDEDVVQRYLSKIRLHYQLMLRFLCFVCMFRFIYYLLFLCGCCC